MYHRMYQPCRPRPRRRRVGDIARADPPGRAGTGHIRDPREVIGRHQPLRRVKRKPPGPWTPATWPA